MNNKYYRYPLSISIAKEIAKILIILMIILTIYLWITAKRVDYDTNFDYVGTLFSPLLMGVALLMYTCSFSNVGVGEQGLLVEFFWFYIKVPWENIIGMKNVASKPFEICLIKTKNSLTFFHRLFSLSYAFSFEPSLPIHTRSTAQRELIKEIRKHI